MRGSTAIVSKTSKKRDALLNVEKKCRNAGYILSIH